MALVPLCLAGQWAACLRARILLCGVRDVMGESKIVALFFVLTAASLYLWSQRRIIDLTIADVTFHVPNSAIVSASAIRGTSGDLDSTQGAFLELPAGPYYGKWGILLQSSKERKAKGFPLPFATMDHSERAADVLKKTKFGWYQCTECGKDTWYFRRAPVADDSIYSVNSIVCHKTEICELFFSYQNVDVTVSLPQSDIENAPKSMEQAVTLLSSLSSVKK